MEGAFLQLFNLASNLLLHQKLRLTMVLVEVQTASILLSSSPSQLAGAGHRAGRWEMWSRQARWSMSVTEKWIFIDVGNWIQNVMGLVFLVTVFRFLQVKGYKDDLCMEIVFSRAQGWILASHYSSVNSSGSYRHFWSHAAHAGAWELLVMCWGLG